MTGEFSFFGMYFPVLMLTSLMRSSATTIDQPFSGRKGFTVTSGIRLFSMSPSFSSYSVF